MTDAALPSRIIQLVARFRPDADGVGETALNLADVLLSDYGIRSDFLVFKSAGPRDKDSFSVPDRFPVVELDQLRCTP